MTNPSDYNLPHDEWRPSQQEALDKLSEMCYTRGGCKDVSIFCLNSRPYRDKAHGFAAKTNRYGLGGIWAKDNKSTIGRIKPRAYVPNASSPEALMAQNLCVLLAPRSNVNIAVNTISKTSGEFICEQQYIEGGIPKSMRKQRRNTFLSPRIGKRLGSTLPSGGITTLTNCENSGSSNVCDSVRPKGLSH